jgi:curved DNA-binding protein CbpA
MKDYYYILGVNKTASNDEIKKAYRKLSNKFHPDKNEGDPFFAERFKDINEAYVILSDITKRSHYDKTHSQCEESNVSNFVPSIDFFKANKDSFEYDEPITFSWRTINSNKVTLKPFGEVSPIGQKTYLIKNFKNKTLTFSLIAENINIEKEVSSSIEIRNRTFEEFYSLVRKDIELEKLRIDSQTRSKAGNNQNEQNNPSKKKSESFSSSDIILILLCIIIVFYCLAKLFFFERS